VGVRVGAVDPRLGRPRWDPAPATESSRTRLRVLALAGILCAVWYLSWLLQPERVGQPVLYGLLVAAECFNLSQIAGFWWTATRRRRTRRLFLARSPPVDVLVPVYDEPVEIVEPTIAAAVRMKGNPRVMLLHDGDDPAMGQLARRYGVRYRPRKKNVGAKAGSINSALHQISAPFVAIFDCDHVPDRSFLVRTLGHFADPAVAFVQTPQYYANSTVNAIGGAAAAQQELFFGTIARGKDAVGAMFCCGTNVVFRRDALDAVGGFPEHSLTEDFELSISLHEAGWKSRYVPEVLASGLGPEDMSAYVSQQLRWARGCLSTLPRILFAYLPLRVKGQYLLSSIFWLTGWTILLYVSLPIIRIFTGAQPVAATYGGQFLVYFGPYFAAAVVFVAVAGGGAYTYRACTLLAASFWVHVYATIASILRLPSRFVVTPKEGAGGWQPAAVWPTLLVLAALVGAAVYGLSTSRAPAMLNNVAFVLFHTAILGSGAVCAFERRRSPARAEVPQAGRRESVSSGGAGAR
jgi:cellulose synthase (UDP-forming)